MTDQNVRLAGYYMDFVNKSLKIKAADRLTDQFNKIDYAYYPGQDHDLLKIVKDCIKLVDKS